MENEQFFSCFLFLFFILIINNLLLFCFLFIINRVLPFYRYIHPAIYSSVSSSNL
ncbi:hypothetical protein KSS87_018684 [Heliosperma pusillum]|nr:hypothetical protein KSS87_003270 [Heliosperma pusillum]KAH9619445.1 hypothetical protein KSS87_018684 [Heliosperma pusillum]